MLLLLLFLSQETVPVARMVTGLAITLTIPVQREWKIALMNIGVNWTLTNAAVQWNRIQVCTFYLSIKSLSSNQFTRTSCGTSPLGHLFSRDTSIQGTQNLVPKKRPHNLWIYYLYWGEMDTFSGFRNPGVLNFHYISRIHFIWGDTSYKGIQNPSSTVQSGSWNP